MAPDMMDEIRRKAIHIMIIFVLIGYYIISINYGKPKAMLCLVALLIVFFILEYLRLDLGIRMPFIEKLIRPKEQFRVYGVIYFLCGTIIALAVFDFKIAVAAILMATFGDMAAALVGKRFGKTLLCKNKTSQGCTAELIVNLVVGLAVMFGSNIYIPIAMAFTATIVETLADELDDNLLVPIFSGFVGQILISVL